MLTVKSTMIICIMRPKIQSVCSMEHVNVWESGVAVPLVCKYFKCLKHFFSRQTAQYLNTLHYDKQIIKLGHGVVR